MYWRTRTCIHVSKNCFSTQIGYNSTSAINCFQIEIVNNGTCALLFTEHNMDSNHGGSKIRLASGITNLAQYLTEHRNKIRLCGNLSRVLVLSLPSMFDNNHI
jgi:hypothetical protein